MSVERTPDAGWAERLQQIDRRILYLILVVMVSIPIVYPMRIKNAVAPMSRSLWETIDQTPRNKVVLLSSTWSNSTRGENGGQCRAILEHMMSRKIRFLVSSFTPQGTKVARDIIESLSPKYGYVYGRDWVHLGFQASSNNFVKGINADFRGTVKKDVMRKAPLASFPLMSEVKSIDDVHIVVEVSASASHYVWIQFLKPGVRIGFCPTSVMAPEALPYYSSGQLCGILWGAKGAYDYEQLNVEHGTGSFGTGQRYMGPVSAAFALIIVSIAVGNIAMFSARRRSAAKGV